MDRAYPSINNLLEQAACITGRSKEATGEAEPTEGYKGRQIKELIEFANANNFIRINAHNKFFSNAHYQMIGFSYNGRQEFSAVFTQPYILAEREATEDEIAEYMEALGFEMGHIDEFHNDQYELLISKHSAKYRG